MAARVADSFSFSRGCPRVPYAREQGISRLEQAFSGTVESMLIEHASSHGALVGDARLACASGFEPEGRGFESLPACQ